jgi:hypothetical protein
LILPEKLDPRHHSIYFAVSADSLSTIYNEEDGTMTPRSLILGIVAILLASCAAQFPFIAASAQSETAELKNICAREKCFSAEVKIADSLFSRAEQLLRRGKNEAAYGQFSRAGVLYRVALTKASIQLAGGEIAREEQALAKTRDDVSAYRQVLHELQTAEPKP